MKRIKIKVTSVKTTDGFNLFHKGGGQIQARCGGEAIEWNKRGIIEASLQLPKTLEFTVDPRPYHVAVTVFQTSTNTKKEFILEMDSEELFLANLESGMKKMETFIREIESYFADLIDDGIETVTEYSIGGNPPSDFYSKEVTQ